MARTVVEVIERGPAIGTPTGLIAYDDLTQPTLFQASISVIASGDTTIVAGIANVALVPISLFFVTDASVRLTFKSGSAAMGGAMFWDANNGAFGPSEFSSEWGATVKGEALVLNAVPVLTTVVGVGGILTYKKES